MATALRSKGTVLIADDTDAIRRLCADALDGAGFDVRQAADGAQAAGGLVPELDAVISDINMPGMDGLSLLKRVREIDRDLQVVLMTGSPDVQSAITALEYGALRYMTKPFTIDTLVSNVGLAVTMSRLARTKREALDLLGDGDAGLDDPASLVEPFERALDQIHMDYQPIVTWRDRRVEAYEALLRSRCERFASPLALLRAAQQLGRLHDVGQRVRAAVARDLDRADVPPDALVFVNLHPDDLLDPSLGGASDPLLPHSWRIVYEITERKALSDLRVVKDRVTRLRRAGFRIALDDVGAGYAGLSTFSLLEPEVIKLDMSLVRDVHHSTTKQRIVKSIVDLGRDLNLEQVVIEGVETAEERDMLVSLGGNCLQGFLFARPGPPFPVPAGL